MRRTCVTYVCCSLVLPIRLHEPEHSVCYFSRAEAHVYSQNTNLSREKKHKISIIQNNK